MDHMGHDHSAHAGMAESMDGPIPHPSHGGWLGHMLPGWFFFGWATWWLIGVFRLYLKSSVKAPYSARTWYDFPFSSRVPIEPLLKVLLTFIGINGELWFGHESWRCAIDCLSQLLSSLLLLCSADQYNILHDSFLSETHPVPSLHPSIGHQRSGIEGYETSATSADFWHITAGHFMETMVVS